jgi:hypothetical protein
MRESLDFFLIGFFLLLNDGGDFLFFIGGEVELKLFAPEFFSEFFGERFIFIGMSPETFFGVR